MSIWSATASSSSSQSSRLSWQPSQEANFHTARRGRVRRATQISRMLKNGAMRSKRKTGPSRQTKAGPNWQCPQKPIAHFMLRSIERKIRSVTSPRWRSASMGKPHHDLRPAHHCHRVIRIDWRASDQRRGAADITPPISRGVIDRDRDVDIEAPSPCFEFPPIEDVGRSPRAIEHDDLAVTLAVSEHVANYWAQRSQTEAACHDDDVAALAIENGPG